MAVTAKLTPEQTRAILGPTCVACIRPLKNGKEWVNGYGPFHVRCAKRYRERTP